MTELILRADKSLLTNGSEFVYGEDGGIVKIKVARGIYPTTTVDLTERVTGVKLYIHDVESGATATVDCEYNNSESSADKNFDIYLSNPITAAITTAGKRFVLWVGVSVKDTYTTYVADPDEDIVTYQRAVKKSHPIGMTVIGVPDADGGLNGKGLELMVQWNLRLEDAKAYMERAEKAAEATETARNEAVSAKEDAETARGEAVSAKEDAETARGEAVSAKEDAETARDETVSAKEDAETARDETVSAKEDAETARNEAVSAKEDAETARNEAVSAKEAAETVVGEAVSAKEDAETARNEAVSAKEAAETVVGEANWIYFEINEEDGCLYATQSDNFDDAEFSINENGELEVIYI